MGSRMSVLWVSLALLAGCRDDAGHSGVAETSSGGGSAEGSSSTAAGSEESGNADSSSSMRVVGMSGLGWPASSAKPSSTTKRRGASTSSTSQYPDDFPPSGPVIT